VRAIILWIVFQSIFGFVLTMYLTFLFYTKRRQLYNYTRNISIVNFQTLHITKLHKLIIIVIDYELKPPSQMRKTKDPLSPPPSFLFMSKALLLLSIFNIVKDFNSRFYL